tara:strand:+ start:187 stop:378 length:192 start_codon:yes stop_codon:yes gene_type:complete
MAVYDKNSDGTIVMGEKPYNDMKFAVGNRGKILKKTDAEYNNPKLNSKLKETYLIMKGNQYKT